MREVRRAASSGVRSATLVLLGQLLACSAGSSGPPPPSAAGPPPPSTAEPQLLLSTNQVPELVSIGPDGSRIYLGSLHALGSIDVATGRYEPLAGDLLASEYFGLGVIEHPADVARSGDWLYFHSWGYRIQRLFVGADGKAVVEQ